MVTSTHFSGYPIFNVRALVGTAILIGLFTGVDGQSALHEPPDGKVLLGGWTQPDSGYSDFPVNMNQRLAPETPPLGMYQLAQTIPVQAFDDTTGAGGIANITMVEETGTDAALFLTVYPSFGLDKIEDSDLTDLGNQIKDIQDDLNRTVFLRFAPEMAGPWNPGWGVQPTAFLDAWKRLYPIVKEIAPDCIIVWSPNIGSGYPFGAPLPNNSADAALLDTNHDGQLTNEDDAYAPYYPGDEFVDWCGISIYYKGPGFRNLNENQPAGYCAAVLNGVDPFYGEPMTPFYETYCTKPGKACVVSESGAAFHDEVTNGSTIAEYQQGWWEDCLLNATHWSNFPRIKAHIMFEHTKIEFDGGIQDLRDYRVTNDTESLDLFKAALAGNQSLFVFANTRAPSPNISSVTAGLEPTSSRDLSLVETPTGSTTGDDSSGSHRVWSESPLPISIALFASLGAGFWLLV